MRSRHHRRMRAQATALAHACLHAHLKNEIYIYIYVATHAALLSLHSPHVYTAKINYNGTLCKDTGTFVSTIATMSVLLLLLLSLCGGKQPHKYKCPKNISFPFFFVSISSSLSLSLCRHQCWWSWSVSKFNAKVFLLCSWRTSLCCAFRFFFLYYFAHQFGVHDASRSIASKKEINHSTK